MAGNRGYGDLPGDCSNSLCLQVRLDCETRSAQRTSEHANPANSGQRDGFQAETLRLLIIAKPRRTMLRTTNEQTNCKL